MNAQSSASSRRVPGDWLLHPLALGAVLLMALNDRVLKASFGSWWTGKLSDAAGMLFFPWFLLCVWELTCWAVRRPWRATEPVLGASVAITLVGFSAIQVSPWAGHAYQAAVQATWQALSSAAAQTLCPGLVRHTVDPTDLIVLPLLVVPWRLGLRRIRRERAV